MTLEEKVSAYKELRSKIEELESQKKIIAAEILQLIPQETKAVQVSGSTVRRISRLSIKISIENAKILDAVKMLEVVDREKIKKLFERGDDIPDVEEIHSIQVYSLPAK